MFGPWFQQIYSIYVEFCVWFWILSKWHLRTSGGYWGKGCFMGFMLLCMNHTGCANTVLVTRCGFGSSHARVRSSSCTTRPAGSNMCSLSLLACSSLRNPRYCHYEAVFCNCLCDYSPDFISCIGNQFLEKINSVKFFHDWLTQVSDLIIPQGYINLKI